MPAVPDITTIGAIPLFHGLTTDQLSGLAELLRFTTFPTGTNLVTLEQPGEIAYVILNGTVKVHAEQANGVDVILAILGPGEVVGEMSIVDSLGRSATAVTMEESTLCWIDRVTFWECLRTMPEVGYNLVNTLSRRLRLANTQIQSLGTLDVYGRLARQLLAFAQEYGETSPDGDIVIPLRLTQNDLASLVGASRVRVNQVFVAYKRRNYLSVDRNHRITIHDRTALAAAAG